MVFRLSASFNKGLLAALTACVLAMAPLAAADSITFDTDLSFNMGNVTYDGLGGALSGTGIPLDFVTASFPDVPNSATMRCVDSTGILDPCLLSFTTGTRLSETPPPPGITSINWRGNNTPGSFELTGFLLHPDGMTIIDGSGMGAAGPLLTGTVGRASMLRTSGQQWTISIGGPDTKNTDMLDVFYTPASPPPFWAFTGTNIIVELPDAKAGFNTTVKNTDIVNESIPVPGSSLLMLLGLSALAVARRRR